MPTTPICFIFRYLAQQKHPDSGKMRDSGTQACDLLSAVPASTGEIRVSVQTHSVAGDNAECIHQQSWDTNMSKCQQCKKKKKILCGQPRKKFYQFIRCGVEFQVLDLWLESLSRHFEQIWLQFSFILFFSKFQYLKYYFAQKKLYSSTTGFKNLHKYVLQYDWRSILMPIVRKSIHLIGKNRH